MQMEYSPKRDRRSLGTPPRPGVIPDLVTGPGTTLQGRACESTSEPSAFRMPPPNGPLQLTLSLFLTVLSRPEVWYLTAGTQPCRGITRWKLIEDDERGTASTAVLPFLIGFDRFPHALKIPAPKGRNSSYRITATLHFRLNQDTSNQ